jgi:hypothetical protein
VPIGSSTTVSRLSMPIAVNRDGSEIPAPRRSALLAASSPHVRGIISAISFAHAGSISIGNARPEILY